MLRQIITHQIITDGFDHALSNIAHHAMKTTCQQQRVQGGALASSQKLEQS